MNAPLVITNGDDTYLLVHVDPRITPDDAAALRNSWHAMVDFNDRIQVKLFYVRDADDCPIEVTW